MASLQTYQTHREERIILAAICCVAFALGFGYVVGRQVGLEHHTTHNRATTAQEATP